MSGTMARRILVAGVLVMGVATLHSAIAGQRKSSLHEEASRIANAVKKAMGNVEVSGMDKERVEIQAYEVRVVKDGVRYEVIVTSDGEILKIENELEIKDVPAKVAEALNKLADGAKISEIERVERRAVVKVEKLATPEVLYEAEWRVNGKEVEVTVDAKGNVVNSCEDDDDHHDDGDDDGEEDDD